MSTNDDGKITVWVTKYALTAGIERLIVRASDKDGYTFFDRGNSLKLGRDFTMTRDEAIARAEVMRTVKLASLDRQMTDLRKIDFDKKTPAEPAP